jgi:predicted nucleic acid-binding protein
VAATSSGYLLDTNVIFELMKPKPARSVAAWIVATPENLMYLSVMTIGEIRKGIDLLDEDEPKRGALQSWLDHDPRVRFAGRLLPFDEWVAERWVKSRHWPRGNAPRCRRSMRNSPRRHSITA